MPELERGIWIAVCVVAALGCRATPSLVLRHATVIDIASGRKLSNQTLAIEGERITRVGAFEVTASRSIDLHGRFVIPGLWDMHVHFNDPRSARSFIANGVTGVRVMWGNPDHFAMRRTFDAQRAVGPRMEIASQLLDGSPPLWSAATVVTTPDEATAAVSAAKRSGADFIKVYSRLSRAAYFAIAEESRKQGLPFVGHVPFAISAFEASAAGQRSVEHLTGIALATSSRAEALAKAREQFVGEAHGPREWFAFERREELNALASYEPARAERLFAQFVAKAPGTSRR